MIHKTVKTIHQLRFYLFILIVVGFFGTLGLNPIDISKFVGVKIGQAVGMSITVKENPFNKLALQLKNKENSLDEREKTLDLREKNLSAVNYRQNAIIYILAGGIVILFLLIVINFFLDFKRRHQKNNI